MLEVDPLVKLAEVASAKEHSQQKPWLSLQHVGEGLSATGLGDVLRAAWTHGRGSNCLCLMWASGCPR